MNTDKTRVRHKKEQSSFPQQCSHHWSYSTINLTPEWVELGRYQEVALSPWGKAALIEFSNMQYIQTFLFYVNTNRVCFPGTIIRLKCGNLIIGPCAALLLE